MANYYLNALAWSLFGTPNWQIKTIVNCSCKRPAAVFIHTNDNLMSLSLPRIHINRVFYDFSVNCNMQQSGIVPTSQLGNSPTDVGNQYRIQQQPARPTILARAPQ